MIDFHSHILPNMDDGSRSIEESVALLEMLSEQGITTCIATPHFYAEDENVESFLKRREDAFARMSCELSDSLPKVICGAEVSYYSGISRLAELSALCIENSKLLLLEMPMSKWTTHDINGVLEIARRGDVKVVIAHLDRYRKFQSADALRRLRENGILMQCNADFFLRFKTKRKSLSMLKNGEIQFIGSDCHNVHTRAPKIGKAFEEIEKKYGEHFLSDMHRYGKKQLNLL